MVPAQRPVNNASGRRQLTVPTSTVARQARMVEVLDAITLLVLRRGSRSQCELLARANDRPASAISNRRRPRRSCVWISGQD